jgi:hypothetical protein
MTRRAIPSVLAVLAWCLASAVAEAHPTPGSVAYIDFTVDGARVEQDVPLEELERALHQPLIAPGETPENAVDFRRGFLREYAALHLRAEALGSDAAWQTEVLGVTGHDSPDGPRVRFQFALHAPTGDASDSIAFHDDLVGHEVISHYITVYVRSDWAAGGAKPEPLLAGVLHAGRNDVTVARKGSFVGGLRSVVELGMEHIATGVDHLLFLFALILVAPVSALGGRWASGKGRRQTLLALLRVVSAFTVGHSVTLALGALGWIAVPPALVEAAIAGSVLVTAVHALRPLFPRREAVVAGVFGLVHGLAFAQTLAGRDLGRAQAAWTLLGFNTGIELAQLGILALVLPWLLILAGSRAYSTFRVAGASVIVVCASSWLAERTLGVFNPLDRPLAWLTEHPLVPLFALAALAVGLRAGSREPSRSLDTEARIA